MPTATVTSKGQVTIPKPVRDRLGVTRGDRIEFILGVDGSVRLRPLAHSVTELAGFLSRPGRESVTTGEMGESVVELLALRDVCRSLAEAPDSDLREPRRGGSM